MIYEPYTSRSYIISRLKHLQKSNEHEETVDQQELVLPFEQALVQRLLNLYTPKNATPMQVCNSIT